MRFSHLRNKPISGISSLLNLFPPYILGGPKIMSKVAEFRLRNVVQTVATQREIIDAIRYDLTERQADSHNHFEQDALQAELDHYTAIAADLERALEKLAA